MKRYAIALAVFLSALTLTGCAGLGQILPGGAKMTDAQLKGFVGEPEPVFVTSPAGDELEVGCFLPLNVRGEEEPIRVLLVGRFAEYCDLERNAEVTVNGVADPGGLVNPTRINPAGVGR